MRVYELSERESEGKPVEVLFPERITGRPFGDSTVTKRVTYLVLYSYYDITIIIFI